MGPTNSGKTYHALKQLELSSSGININHPHFFFNRFSHTNLTDSVYFLLFIIRCLLWSSEIVGMGGSKTIEQSKRSLWSDHRTRKSGCWWCKTQSCHSRNGGCQLWLWLCCYRWNSGVSKNLIFDTYIELYLINSPTILLYLDDRVQNTWIFIYACSFRTTCKWASFVWRCCCCSVNSGNFKRHGR